MTGAVHVQFCSMRYTQRLRALSPLSAVSAGIGERDIPRAAGSAPDDDVARVVDKWIEPVGGLAELTSRAG